MKETTDDSLLTDTDVRAIVRILGEVCALPGGHAECKRFLMDGLCRLLDAEAWVWGLAAEMNPTRLPVYVGFLHGGFQEEQFGEFLKIQANPIMVEVTSSFSRELKPDVGRQLTRTLQQIIDPVRWSQPDIRDLWSPCGVHPRCLSFHSLGECSYSGIALYRRIGLPLFTPREARMVHILMTEIPWLHQQGWPEDRAATVPRLSPRLRWALELLLQSHGRKQLAKHLGISPHTADGYVKEIYQHFGVHSQAELMARFYRGNGADQLEVNEHTRQ